eukprot:661877-Rhodomonas_salina.1
MRGRLRPPPSSPPSSRLLHFPSFHPCPSRPAPSPPASSCPSACGPPQWIARTSVCSAPDGGFYKEPEVRTGRGEGGPAGRRVSGHSR